MLSREFFEDPTVGRLEPMARLLLLGLFVKCADADYPVDGDEAYLRAMIFPYDREITPEQVAVWRDQIIESVPYIEVEEYTDGGFELLLGSPKWMSQSE